MRHRRWNLLGLSLVPVLSGCLTYGPESYGPDVDARREQPGMAATTAPPDRQAQLDSDAAAPVARPDEKNEVRTEIDDVAITPPRPSGRLAALGDRAFNAIGPTNRIELEWLRPPTNFFRLGPGDVIEIENLGQPGTRGISLVGPDGRIYYSLLPGVSVWGLTLTETKELLEKELNRFTRVKPELAVTLRSVGSKRIWLLGSVPAPGVYPMATPLTVLEALSLAGGVSPVAGSASGMPDLRNSFLMRNGQMLRIDFHRLISQGDLSQNVYLQADDFIYLRSSTSRNVFVLGAVASPNIVPYADRMSVLSAITTAGGTVPYARVTHVAIVRGSLSHPKLAVVNYQAIYSGKAADVRLEQGDIVYVPFVPYRKLAVLAEEMLGTLVRTIAANEGQRAVLPGVQPIGVATPVTGPIQ